MIPARVEVTGAIPLPRLDHVKNWRPWGIGRGQAMDAIEMAAIMLDKMSAHTEPFEDNSEQRAKQIWKHLLNEYQQPSIDPAYRNDD